MKDDDFRTNVEDNSVASHRIGQPAKKSSKRKGRREVGSAKRRKLSSARNASSVVSRNGIKEPVNLPS